MLSYTLSIMEGKTMLNKKMYYNEDLDVITTSPTFKREGEKIIMDAIPIIASKDAMVKLYNDLSFNDLINTPEFVQYAQIVTKHVVKWYKAFKYIPQDIADGLMQEYIIYAYENKVDLQALKDEGATWQELHVLMYRKLSNTAQNQIRADYRVNKVLLSLDATSGDDDNINYLDDRASMQAHILSTRQLEQQQLLDQFKVYMDKLLTVAEIKNIQAVISIKEQQKHYNQLYWRDMGLLITNAHRASMNRAKQKLKLLPREFIEQLLG